MLRLVLIVIHSEKYTRPQCNFPGGATRNEGGPTPRVGPENQRDSYIFARYCIVHEGQYNGRDPRCRYAVFGARPARNGGIKPPALVPKTNGIRIYWSITVVYTRDSTTGAIRGAGARFLVPAQPGTGGLKLPRWSQKPTGYVYTCILI
jgi:hypothetical protein